MTWPQFWWGTVGGRRMHQGGNLHEEDDGTEVLKALFLQGVSRNPPSEFVPFYHITRRPAILHLLTSAVKNTFAL